MRASCWALAVLFGMLGHAQFAVGREGPFDGEWRSSIGIVTLKQDGNTVTGTYGNAGQFALKGNVAGKSLTFEYQEGQAKGDARFTLDDSGNAFTGGFQIRGGQGGRWDGWRLDPDALTGDPSSIGGLWLTTLGLMDLTQNGTKVKGTYALRGTSEIEGDVKGRRLEFRFTSFRPGTGWFDLSKDGKSLAGAGNTSGFPGWFGWRGRPAPEFARHAKLVAGRVVDGSTKGLLSYSIRAPEGYTETNKSKWPTILILHGSNMNGKSYVSTLAAAWPDIAKEYILLGINGEMPSDTGDDPRFNFSYVNYVGKSTYKGFPGTDRESPALVHEAMAELKEVYPIARYFVGGHSQGGFLTYSLLMNFPEAIAGAFPISCGVIFQCEPQAFDDEAVRAAQRRVPLAIVHGKNDPVVDFSMGQYAAGLFGEANWPACRFFVDETNAHMFGRLPVGAAIRWLEAHSSEDPSKLLEFGEERFNEGGYRDAVAALSKARSLKANASQQERLAKLGRQIDAKTEPLAAGYLASMQKNTDGSWVDDFLAFRDDFEFADKAADAIKAFHALRAQHDPRAKKAFGEARAAFQQGRKDDGYAKYQEIVDKDYASSLYRFAKRQLAERK
jgi:predicted esterase